jgi:EmrB/QacA subfamily drug resistance transporter
MTQRATLTVAILASFIAFLDGTIVNVALPAIADAVGGQVQTQQWVLDAYLLSLGALILLTGSLADSLGRVRIMRAGLTLFGIASVACAVAPTAGVLIAARAVQGAGAALLVPTALALITSTFPTRTRGRAIGTWTAWTSAAFIVGPLLGGGLVDIVGWRWIFAINVIPIGVTLFLLRGAREHRPEGRAEIDVIGAVLIAAGLTGIVFGLIEAPTSGWVEPAVWIPLTVGAICLAGFLVWERLAAVPLLPLTLFRNRDFASGNLATFAIYGGITIGPVVVVLYLQEVEGYSATAAGLTALPAAIMSLLLSRVFGSLATKHGPRLFVAAGCLITAGGYLLMAAGRPPINIWLEIVPGLFLYGIGLAITVAPLTTTVLSAAPPERAGIASAVNNAVARIASLIAIALLSAIIGPTLTAAGFNRALIVTAVVVAAGAVIGAVGMTGTPVRAGQLPLEARANCTDRLIPAAVNLGVVPADAEEPDASARR